MSEDKMDKHVFAELLKYPLLVFSVFLTLLAAKYLLGLEFGLLTEVSTAGVKFADKNHATLDAVIKLEGEIKTVVIGSKAEKNKYNQ